MSFCGQQGPPGTGKQQARLFFFFFLYFAQFSYCWQKLRPSLIWCHGFKRQGVGSWQAMGCQGPASDLQKLEEQTAGRSNLSLDSGGI